MSGTAITRSLAALLLAAAFILPARAQTVVINEMDADQEGTDAAEFVELYDGGTGNTDLSGHVLVFFNGSDDASYQAFDLDGQSTDENGFFVLCGNAATVPNCDLDVGIPENLIQNGADAIALLVGDATSFPEDTPVTTDNLVDAIVYDTDDADDLELLVLLNAGQPQVDERGGGDGTGHSSQRIPDGAGGPRNTDTYVQAPPTPGAANSTGVVVQVVINEMDADQAGTDAAEFVELYDGGVGNTDLSGHVLVFFNGNGDTSYQAFDLAGQSTDENGFFVLCGNAATVANCDLDVGIPENLIQNGADAIALYAGDATAFPAGTPITVDGLVDAIVYDTNDPDDAELMTLLNAGQPQVDEQGGGDGTAHSSQRIPDGSGGPRNTDTFVQAPPTPGAANSTGVSVDAADELPTAVHLEANYPNPFNPATRIAFLLPAAGHVRLAVTDALGRIVAELIDADVPAGRHEHTFDARSLPSGIYFARVETAGQTVSRPMVLLK